MDPRLLDLLVCPLCKGKLRHDRTNAELVCRADRLAFPIRDGIPQMLVENARTLSDAASETSRSVPESTEGTVGTDGVEQTRHD